MFAFFAAHDVPARLRKHAPAGAVLALIVVVLTFGLCQTYSDFWFEDDAPHRAFVRDHANPLAYFGPKLVSELSLGHSVTPWFPLTFWVDHQISGFGAWAAYLHSALSLWLCACALYLVLAQFTGRRGAMAAAGLWLLLPSTLVTLEFLSTRHYLEGLLISLVAFYFGLKSNAGTGAQRNRDLALALGLYLLCCTTKEVYVSATFFALLCIFFDKRRWSAMALLCLCGAAYAGYRLLSLGMSTKVTGSPLSSYYGRFLERWPFMFTGNNGGYLLLICALLVFVALLVKRRIPMIQLVYGLGLGAVMLLTILPVSEHVTEAYRELGTWYRVLFLFNSYVLIVGACLLSRFEYGALRTGLIALLGACLALGAWQSSRNWDGAKAKYRIEAEFYMAHPDRLLYSTLPAYWYLYGIHKLYQPELEPHFATYNNPKDCAVIERFGQVWCAGSQGVYADEALLGVLRENCRNQVVPLHQGWSPR